MALRTTIDINVDFYDKKYILINAKQYDKNSRFLSVTCYNHGVLYPINSGEHSAYIRYKKSDGHSVFNFCEINNQDKIIVELTEQMLACDGICYADLVIVQKGSANVNDAGEIVVENSGVLSTMTFCVDVSETAVVNSEIELSSDFIQFNKTLEEYWANYEAILNTVQTNADNAKVSEDKAKKSELAAKESEINASISESNAKTSEENAKVSEDNAKDSENNASLSEINASSSETAAKGYATTAQNSMTSAMNSASYALTSATNAYGYYLQTEAITNGLNGAFLPKGTITFVELLELKDSGAIGAGYLYHISDGFTTDENFRVSGKVCGAGTSVYYTVDDTFDVFVGATVAGVKGGNETEYRTGMVDITVENIGAISTMDIATVDEMKNYLGI